jgi:hypothetical protein
MQKFKFLNCLAAVLLTLPVGVVPATADDDHERRQFHKNSIEGAWEVIVTLRVSGRDCATAPVIGVGPNPFTSFNTFHKGGTMNEWGTRSPPATRGAGHGVWKRLGDDRFAYRLKFHSFDANGLFANTMDIRSELALADDGLSFEGVSRFTFTDLSGNARLFCATLAGTRLAL